jgi:tubulin monoglycylase TTLL3/8
MTHPAPAESAKVFGDALNDFSEEEARLRTLNDIVHRGNPATFIRKENKAPSSSHMAKFRLAQTHNPVPPKKVGLGVFIKQQKPNALAPLDASTSGAANANANGDAAFPAHPTEKHVFGRRLLSSAGDASADFSVSEPSAGDSVNAPLSSLPEATRSHPSSAKPSYRKRYLQMLRSMEMEARQKKEEEEQRQVLDERKRAKLREKVIGSEDVGSKFLSATVDALKAAEEAKLARMQHESKMQVDPETAKEEERQRQREANKQIAEKTKLLLQAIETKKKAEAEREARLRRKAEAIKKKVREVVLELCQRAPRAENSDGGSSSGEDDTPKKVVRVRKPAQFPTYEDAQKYFWDSAKHPHGSKVFMSTYPLVKEELIKRGWVENPDFEDCVFDAKFVLKTSDIEYKALRREQVVNHFSKASAITTKVGLMRSLLTLKWFENVEIDSFFPRCYDLNDLDELEDWVEDFKRTACQSLLSKFVAAGGASGVTDSWGDPMLEEDALKSAQLCILVLEQYLKKSELEAIDEPCDESLQLTPEEWGLILCESSPRIVRPSYCPKIPATASSKDAEPPAASKKKLSKLRPKSANTIVARAREILAEIESVNQQFKIDGVTNTWIIKPAGKSRGRGIICTNKINDMLKHMGMSVSGATSHWVAQKYIENPFLINGKKFDIRQWVIVTDWNPVTIYIYDECYFRLCMQDYNLDTFDPFVHLSNNSIQSTSEGFETIVESSMWAFNFHCLTEHI